MTLKEGSLISKKFNQLSGEFDGSIVAIAYIFSVFLSFTVAAILYIWKHNDVSPSTRKGLADALNFTISYLIWIISSLVLIFAVVGVVIFPIVYIAYFFFAVKATIKNARGSYYVPPFTLSIIK